MSEIELTPFTFPITGLEIVGVITVFLVTVLANAGGIGGGGLNIPFMSIFLGLSIKECVPIANFSGFIAPFIRFILNFKQRHPTRKERVVVDYELISLTMPIIYLGTLFGVRIGTYLTDV